MSYNVDIKGTSNLGTISNDVRTFADSVKQAAASVGSASGQFKAGSGSITQFGSSMRPIPSTAQQMNGSMTQMQGALRGVQTALTGGASAMKGFQGSLGPTNTLLGQVTNTASQSQAALNGLVGSAGPLASSFTSTGQATQQFSGALGQMNTQTVSSTGSLKNYLVPLNQGTGTTNQFGQATQRAGGMQAQFSKNIGGTIIPIVGLVSSVAEAIGMFQTYMDVQQNVARVQQEVNALEKEGATNTEQYRRASQELQSSQRGLNFVFRSTIQSFVDIITFIALVSNSFIKMAKAAKEAQKAQEALGTATTTSTGFLTKMTGAFQTLYLKLGPVGIALLAIAGVLLALKTNIGGITDGFRGVGKAIGDALPQTQSFLKSMEAGAVQMGIIDKAANQTTADIMGYGDAWDEAAKEADKAVNSFEALGQRFESVSDVMKDHKDRLAELTAQMDKDLEVAQKTIDARDKLAKIDENLGNSEKSLGQIFYENLDTIVQSVVGYGDIEQAKTSIAAVNNEVAATEADIATQIATVTEYVDKNTGAIGNLRVEYDGLNGMVLGFKAALDAGILSQEGYAAAIDAVWQKSREYSAILDPLKVELDNFNGSTEDATRIMALMADQLSDTQLQWEQFPTWIQQTVEAIGDLADKELTASDKIAILNAALQGHDAALRAINPVIADQIAKVRDWISTHIDASAQAENFTEFMYQLADALQINVDTVPDLTAGMLELGDAMIDSTAATKEGSAELEAAFAAQQEFLRQAIVSWHDYLGAVVSGQSDITSFTNVLKQKVEAGQMDEQVMKFLIDIYKEFDKLVKEGKEPIVAWGEAVVKVTDDLNNAATTTEATGLTMEEFGNMVTEALTDVEKAAAASIPIWGELSDAIEAGFITQENYKDVIAELNQRIKDNTTATADQKAGYENATKAIEIYFKLTDQGLDSQIALNEAIKIANGQYSEYSGLIEKSSDTMSDYDKELQKVVQSYDDLISALTEAPAAQDAMTLAAQRGKESAAEFLVELQTSTQEMIYYRNELLTTGQAAKLLPQLIDADTETIERFEAVVSGSLPALQELAQGFLDIMSNAREMIEEVDFDDWADDFGDAVDKMDDKFRRMADDLGLDEDNAALVELHFTATMDILQEKLTEIGPLIAASILTGDKEAQQAVSKLLGDAFEEGMKDMTPREQQAMKTLISSLDALWLAEKGTPAYVARLQDVYDALTKMGSFGQTVIGVLESMGINFDDVATKSGDAATGIEASGSAAAGAQGSMTTLASSLGSVAERYGKIKEAIDKLGTTGFKEFATEEQMFASPASIESWLANQQKKEGDTTETPTGPTQITVDTQPAKTAMDELLTYTTNIMNQIALAPKYVAAMWPTHFNAAVTAINSGPFATLQNYSMTALQAVVNQATMIIGTGLVEPFNTAITTIQSGPFATLQNYSMIALQAVVNQAAAIIPTLTDQFYAAVDMINSGPFANLQNYSMIALQAVVNQAAALIPQPLTDQFYAAVDMINAGPFANLQNYSATALQAVVNQAAALIPQPLTDQFYSAVDMILNGPYANLQNYSTTIFQAVVNIAAELIPSGLEGEFYKAVDQVISGPYAKLQTESSHAAQAVVNIFKIEIPKVVDVFESAVSDIVAELGKIETAAGDAAAEVKKIGDAITAIPTEKTVTIKVKYEQTGTPPKGYQHGGSFVTNQPSLFMAGEAHRKERVQVRPGVMPFTTEYEDRQRRKRMELRDLLSSFGNRGRYSKGGTAAGTGAGGTPAGGGTVHEQPIEIVLTLPDKEITRVVKKVVWQETSGGYSSY